jgi:hypothetical protein
MVVCGAIGSRITFPTAPLSGECPRGSSFHSERQNRLFFLLSFSILLFLPFQIFPCVLLFFYFFYFQRVRMVSRWKSRTAR